jgi:hypothetical protein
MSARNARAMGHVVLAGDSIFANRTYTGGAPDVISHLRTLILHGVAGDPGRRRRYDPCGDVTASTTFRVDASHVALSIGGVDRRK